MPRQKNSGQQDGTFLARLIKAAENTLADIIFCVGYSRTRYKPVRDAFISWYYEAAKDDYIREELKADNATVSELAVNAATDAKNIREEMAVIEIIEFIEELGDKCAAFYRYVRLFILLGSILAGTTVWEYSRFGGGLIPITTILLMWVLKHQFQQNAKLIELFNQELTMSPGAIREHDQDWEYLAACYFWNNSLCRPVTLHVVILLVLIRMVSTRLYGRISAQLRNDIREFIGKDGQEVLKHQIDRAKEEFWQAQRGK